MRCKVTTWCFQINKQDKACNNRVSRANGYICAAGHGKDRVSLASLASNSLTASERKVLAENQSYPLDKIRVLLGDRSYRVRASLAANPTIDAEVALILANDKDERVRAVIATHSSVLSKETQTDLLHDKSQQVQEALAYNPFLVDKVQIALAKKKNGRVVSRLAANPAITQEAFDIIINSPFRNELGHNDSLLKEQYIALSSRGVPPYGFFKDKNIDEIAKEFPLAISNYAFAHAAVTTLLKMPKHKERQEEELIKNMVVASYAHAYSGDSLFSALSQFAHDKIIKRFPGDEEVKYLIEG